MDQDNRPMTRVASAEIRAVMARDNVSVTELARRLKVSRNSADRYVHGRLPLTIDTVDRIWRALGYTWYPGRAEADPSMSTEENP